MNVILHLVLFLAPALSSPVTEPPSSCTCSDGTKIALGKFHHISDCDICACEEDGPQLIVGDCFYADCADSQRIEGDGHCCPTCPNGKNCAVIIPGLQGSLGTLSDGETAQIGPATCTCNVTNRSFSSSYLHPYPITDCVTTDPAGSDILHPPPPPPPPGAMGPYPPGMIPLPPKCECSDKTKVAIGDSHRINDCLTCECDKQEGVKNVEEKCPDRIICADYKDVDGDGVCCPECPNGKNCKAVVGNSTEIIPDGQTVVLNGSKCTCDVNSQANSNNHYPKAVCET